MNFLQPVYAFTVALPAGKEAPADIQWMPPGSHTITAHQEGKPVTLKVNVHEATAATMNGIVAQILAAGGTKPYFDFNHADVEASGYPTGFFWGGNHPKTGGVRARVEWSEPGAKAVVGRAFQAFSPAFLVDAKGEVVGAPKNMGGLVNEPAFRTIAPLLSRHAIAGQPTNMTEQEELAASKTALATATAELAKVNAKLAELQGNEVIKAKDATITELNGKIIKLETAQQEALKVEAKAAVAEAAADGRIAPQDKDMIAHYEALYGANPIATKAILAKMAKNPALVKIIPGTTGEGTGASASTEHDFVVKAKAFAKEHNIADALEAQAKFAGTTEGTKLYGQYRESLGGKK